jgi:thiol-disulfide isomerase/thioredoxin
MSRTSSRRLSVALAVTAVTLFAACGSDEPSASEPSTSEPASGATVPATVPPSTSTAIPDVTVPGVTTVETVAPTSTAPAIDLAEWQTTPMIDVDGQAFTVADFIGRPVLVETFATWCKNCRAQLGDTQAAAAELGDAAVVLALSVETDLSSGDVADYAADNGFDNIRFAVMTPEALAAFVDAFGNTVANPPSTPKVIVDAMGRAGELSTGAESTDSLVQQLTGAAG